MTLFRGTEDFIRVNDFYLKMDGRKSYIENNNSSAVFASILRKLNEDCLELAEDVLKDVDWSKYR